MTVGSKFASLVEAVDDCEEFDLTIADDPEESLVEVRAPDTDLDAAPAAMDRHNFLSAGLLDALDRDLAMEDEGQDGGDVDTAADSESDTKSEMGVPVDPAPRNLLVTQAIREALSSIDEIDMVPIFKRRPCIMKSPPGCLEGVYRHAMRLALTAGHRLPELGNCFSFCRGCRCTVRGGKIPMGRCWSGSPISPGTSGFRC